MKKTFALMYPGSLNLHGENFSAAAFSETCRKLGVDAEIITVDSWIDPLPEKADIWFFGPGELTTLKLLLPVIKSRKNAFEKHLERGGYILTNGNTGALFGKTVTLLDGTVLEGLGLLDMTAAERRYIKAEDLIFETLFWPHLISGYQNMRFDFETLSPLGKVVRGWGNLNDGREGSVGYDGHLIFTNAMGPLLVKNPWLTQFLIGDTSSYCFSDEEKAQEALINYAGNKPRSRTML